jgi:hypothetical protein
VTLPTGGFSKRKQSLPLPEGKNPGLTDASHHQVPLFMARGFYGENPSYLLLVNISIPMIFYMTYGVYVPQNVHPHIAEISPCVIMKLEIGTSLTFFFNL